MTWLIAMIQISDSKKPINADSVFSPRVRKIIRIVPMETSMIRAQKIANKMISVDSFISIQ